MMTVYLVCFLDHRQAICVRERFAYRDEADTYMRANAGHFLIVVEEL